MARARQRPMVAFEGDTVADMVSATGSAPKEIGGVTRLASGRLKMVDASHNSRLGMLLPEDIAEAWRREAREEGVSQTDLFEDAMLRYLRSKGWDIGV